MKKIKSFIIGSILLGSLVYPTLVANSAITCFKKGEKTSGMNKICYYDCLGSEAAITISAVSLCPLSIQR